MTGPPAEQGPASLTAESAAPAVSSEAGREAAREQRIQWWRDARFGMFIHWGLYSLPAGVWKEHVHSTGYSEWIMFGEKIPAKEYALLAGRFNPVKFDAKAWVAIAKDAGMKYIVMTSKHHDGFTMYERQDCPTGAHAHALQARPHRRTWPPPAKRPASSSASITPSWTGTIPLGQGPSSGTTWDRQAGQAGHATQIHGLHQGTAQGTAHQLRAHRHPVVRRRMGRRWTHEPPRTCTRTCAGLQPGIIVNNAWSKAAKDGGLAGEGNPGRLQHARQNIPANGLPGVDWESCMTMNNH